jgi:hypothetical protein
MKCVVQAASFDEFHGFSGQFEFTEIAFSTYSVTSIAFVIASTT